MNFSTATRILNRAINSKSKDYPLAIGLRQILADEGINSETIELVLVGHELDKTKTDQLVNKAAKLIERKIIYFIVTQNQMKYFFKDKPALLIWKTDA